MNSFHENVSSYVIYTVEQYIPLRLTSMVCWKEGTLKIYCNWVAMLAMLLEIESKINSCSLCMA